METVYIALVIGVVVLIVAWIYRDRLTTGFIRSNKDGIEAGIKANEKKDGPGNKSKVNNLTDETSKGVHISSNLKNSSIKNVAGRDLINTSADIKTQNGSTAGVVIDSKNIIDSNITNVAGRDVVDDSE